MIRLIAINYRCRHWLAWTALLLPCALAAFGSIPNEPNGSSVRRVQYDAAGRMTNRWTMAKGNTAVTNDTQRSFTYDDENELIKVEVASSWKSEFGYDGLHRRRWTKEYSWAAGAWQLGSETRYVYDGNLVIQERDGSNQRLVSYTRGLDLSGSLEGAGGIGGLLARTGHSSSGQTYFYYHSDGNGNVTALMNGDQKVVARYYYDPSGNTLGMSGYMAEANVYRFSSKEFHPNSGLYYYGERYYEPNLQRWINRDPLGEAGGINVYGFCGNNGIGLIDPWGLDPQYVDAWYDEVAQWWMVRVQVAKDFYTDNTHWVVGGTFGTAFDLISVPTIPAQVGHLGDAEGTFSVTPSLNGALYIAADASLAVCRT